MTSRAFDVVVVGSLNLDLVATTRRLPRPGETVHGTGYAEYPGGKGLNQAIAAARCGAAVALVGAIGNDDAGSRLREVVRDHGIDDRWLVSHHLLATGRALIAVDDRAENSIVVVAGANGALTIDPTDFPESEVVLAQLEVPAATIEAAFAVAHGRSARTILNPAPATADLADSLIRRCDVVIPNEHEVAILGGAQSLIDRGVGTVVVTRGAHGADGITEAETTHQPPFPVTPLDTTGAGDSFCGALAAKLAAGSSLAESLPFAAAAGALATTEAGAGSSRVNLDEIARLVAAGTQ